MSDSAACTAPAGRGLGEEQLFGQGPPLSFGLHQQMPRGDLRAGAPAVPPLVAEPLPPRHLLALSHFASVVAQHGSLHNSPSPT